LRCRPTGRGSTTTRSSALCIDRRSWPAPGANTGERRRYAGTIRAGRGGRDPGRDRPRRTFISRPEPQVPKPDRGRQARAQVLERVAERVSRRPGWTSAAVTRVAYSFADAIAARSGSSVMCLPGNGRSATPTSTAVAAQAVVKTKVPEISMAEPIHRLACMCQ
jgi:hypothetical protein